MSRFGLNKKALLLFNRGREWAMGAKAVIGGTARKRNFYPLDA